MPQITVAEFARKVGLDQSRISQLVEDGLPLTPSGKIDFDRAKAWLDANLDPGRRAAAGKSMDTSALGPLAKVRLKKMLEEAKTAELKNKAREGALVDREEAMNFFYARSRFERDAWIGWASRTATDLAAKLGADAQATFVELDKAVRLHLDEIAETPFKMVRDE